MLPEGKIPYLSWNEYRFSEFVQDDVHIPSADALGAQCVRELFADKDGMSAYTLAVTYEHEPDDYYAVTAGKRGKFPRTLEKLKNGQNIKIALYGGTEFFPFRSLFTNNGREPRRRFSRRKNFAAIFKSY